MMKFQHSQQYRSLDELGSAPHGWDVEISPLRHRTGRVGLRLASSKRVMVNRVDFDCATLQTGSSPTAMRTFSLVVAQDRPHYFRGHEITRDAMMMIPRDGELHAVSPGPISLINLSVAEEQLAIALDEQAIACNASKELAEATVVTPHGRAQILSNLESLTAQLAKPGRDAQAQQLISEMETQLIATLADQLVAVTQSEKSVPRNRRYRTVKAALKYIDEHPRDPLSIVTLAREVGASRRTLETGFRDLLDMSPKQYINTCRLRGCRNELAGQRGCPGARVGATAQRWGFWHLGQFARDYQKVFGELPTQTLLPGT